VKMSLRPLGDPNRVSDATAKRLRNHSPGLPRFAATLGNEIYR